MTQSPTVKQIIAELMSIGNGVEYVREYRTDEIIEPREVWIPHLRMWLRANGRYATFGTYAEPRHFNMFDAWKLRRTIKRWVQE